MVPDLLEKTLFAVAEAMCPHCERRPNDINDPRWGWDNADPDSPWIWCPDCGPEIDDDGGDDR